MTRAAGQHRTQETPGGDTAALARHVPNALRVVLRILASWGLTEAQKQAVLGVPRSTLARWKRDPDEARPTRDQVERLSYVLGIRKALEVLEPGEEAERVENGWLRRPNHEPMFGDEPPLKRLTSGRLVDLYEIRRYLDGQRGW